MHQWSTTPANNGSADARAFLVEGSTTVAGLNNAQRGAMATAALWRDDNLGAALIATLGANNVYSVTTGQGLVDPKTQTGGATPAITHPFSLRLIFDKPLTGSGTNAPHLNVDGVDCGPILRRDASAVADGDLPTAAPVLILGDLAAPTTDTKVTRVRVLDLTPSDVALLSAAASGGTIAGLVPSGISGGAISAIMTISPGACADSTLSSFMRTTAAKNWAVTNGAAANGFDGGNTLPANRTLGLFLIWGSAGTATFASTSLTAPALPAGYTFFRLLFPFTTDVNGAPIPFTAIESAGGSLVCFLTAPVLDVSGLFANAARQLFPVSVPLGVPVEWQGNATVIGGGNPSSLYAMRISSPFEPDVDPSTTFAGAVGSQPSGNPIPDVFGGPSGLFVSEITSRRRLTDVSGRLAWRSNYAAGVALYLTTTGWTYARRT